MLQNSIGVLPTEVTAYWWLRACIGLVLVLLLVFSAILVWLFYLQNFKNHPLRLIVDKNDDTFKNNDVTSKIQLQELGHVVSNDKNSLKASVASEAGVPTTQHSAAAWWKCCNQRSIQNDSINVKMSEIIPLETVSNDIKDYSDNEGKEQNLRSSDDVASLEEKESGKKSHETCPNMSEQWYL